MELPKSSRAHRARSHSSNKSNSDDGASVSSASDTHSAKSLSASQLMKSTSASSLFPNHASASSLQRSGSARSEPREGKTRTSDGDGSDHSGAGPYEVIEYDLHEGSSGVDMFSELAEFDSSLHIDDDSPAAQALAANASVRVSQLGKAARAVHMQTVRKIVKRATGATKSGVTRGKPPRLPPKVEGGFADFPSTQLVPIDESSEAFDPSYSADNNAQEEESEQPDSHMPDDVVPATAEAGKRGKAGISVR
jgi:hypothetical protein